MFRSTFAYRINSSPRAIAQETFMAFLTVNGLGNIADALIRMGNFRSRDDLSATDDAELASIGLTTAQIEEVKKALARAQNGSANCALRGAAPWPSRG
jgi:uncharacterized protein YjiS (DUF1127 family)